MTYVISKEKTILVIFTSVIVAIALHLGFLLNGFYGISADESGRTLDAYTWIKTGSPQSDVWLPFHRIIVGAGLLVWNDLFVIPRIISFAFGLVALFAMIWMAHELFHDNKVTITTAVLSALFPPRIILSVVPLTEIEFITFILIGLTFYLRWLRSKNNRQLIMTAVCIGLSTTIRYEGWIFAFVFSVILMVKREDRTSVFVHHVAGYIILLLVGVFPLYWTSVSFQETHLLFGFASSHADRYQRAFHINTLKIIWHSPLTQFIYQNGLLLNLIGTISLVQLFRHDKHKREYLLLPTAAMLVFALVLLTGAGFTTHNPWRISVLWGCLLVPFTAYWIVQHLERHEQSNAAKRHGILVLIAVAFIVQLAWLSRATEFNSSDYQAGKYLKDSIQGDMQQKILIETATWNYVNVIVASNKPDCFIMNTGFDPYAPSNAVLATNTAVDVTELVQKGIHILVFQTPPIISPEQSKYVLQHYHNTKWTVYKLPDDF
jgi:Dolichyl-phosphate-mannose-protein mannosyltransferase